MPSIWWLWTPGSCVIPLPPDGAVRDVLYSAAVVEPRPERAIWRGDRPQSAITISGLASGLSGLNPFPRAVDAE